MKNPSGKKRKGTHTTYTEAAGKVAEKLARSDTISSIVAGVITPGLKSSKRSVKVIKNPTGALLVKVRDVTTIMEVHVIGKDYDAAIAKIEEIAKELHMDFKLEDRTGA
ncbi:MAG: hypothetical protein RL150_269 [Candidatus Parcubacteria bacterium]|jgi:hypothetical protein